MPKQIVVASTNPVKLLAVLNGFQRMFPGDEFEIQGVSVPSGVSDQPLSDAETLRGAQNRAASAAVLVPQADYWAGVEGGITDLDGELATFAWIVIRGRERTSKSRTGAFLLPPRVVELIHQGKELGDADDIVFGRTNSKQENGAIGLLTDNQVDRAALYEQAVILALAPFKNPALYPAREGSENARTARGAAALEAAESAGGPSEVPPAWSEENTQDFVDYGRYFVPDRETQIRTLAELLPAGENDCHVLELCCGEGLLAEAVLEKYPGCRVTGLDGSPGMLDRARQRLARFGERFTARPFDLADTAWRSPLGKVRAVVSSLAIHHLDRTQKELLFQDVFRLVEPGGAFIIADLVQPEHPLGVELAAREWDAAVRQRALEIDGDERAFEFFERAGWNFFRHPDPLDQPSPLLAQLHWLKQAGFQNVDVYWMRAGHAIFGGYKNYNT